MAIIVVFDIEGGTQAQYEDACNQLTRGRGLPKTPSDWPVTGLVSHCAGPTDNGWHVTDVWESEEAFAQFGEVLGPILQAVGMPEAQPKIYQAFNVAG